MLLCCHAEACSSVCTDLELLPQFPPGIQSLLPVFKTEKSGLPWIFVEMMKAMVPAGVSFTTICSIYNQLLYTQQAKKELAFYHRLSSISSAPSGILGPTGQVAAMPCSHAMQPRCDSVVSIADGSCYAMLCCRNSSTMQWPMTPTTHFWSSSLNLCTVTWWSSSMRPTSSCR